MPQPKSLDRFIILCALLLLSGCGALQTPIRDPLQGSCQCPYDLDRTGSCFNPAEWQVFPWFGEVCCEVCFLYSTRLVAVVELEI